MKNFFRLISFIIFVYILLSGLINLGKEQAEIEEEEVAGCTDRMEVINGSNDRWHQRDWRLSGYSASFCTTYESQEKLSLEVGRRRNEMVLDRSEYEDFWGQVYFNLVKDSKSYINFVVDSLANASLMQELSRLELAELIVTFVQDIPYSYVLAKDCESRDTEDRPCIGNISLGLLSPYEFLHSLYGDCDTRAVLIYTLLEEFGFDPMVVVSSEYAHAMLALNVPSTGDHLQYRGKNYYFWETTGKGWPLGVLPPSTNNVNYWKIALVNEH